MVLGRSRNRGSAFKQILICGRDGPEANKCAIKRQVELSGLKNCEGV